MEELALWGGGIGGAISTIVWALKAGGAWDMIPKWARPLLFVALAFAGAAATALGGGATWSAAILAGLVGLTASRAGYETYSGVKAEKNIARQAKATHDTKAGIRALLRGLVK